MTTNSKNHSTHKPNYITIGIVLGCCFMIAMESPALFVVGLSLGIILNRRQRQS